MATEKNGNGNGKKTNWDKLDVPIEYEGRAITLAADPDKMPIPKAIEALQRRLDADNQEYDIAEQIEGYPLDAAVAFVKAANKLFGFLSPVNDGRSRPHMVNVKTGFGVDDIVQCPLGKFKLPGVESPIQNTIVGGLFYLGGRVRKFEKDIVLTLATETRRILREESIYRGKAIRLHVNGLGDLEMENPPEFMDVSDTGYGDLLFDNNTSDQLATNVLVPIHHTRACRKHNIPLKRGILLEGPYGTGKSLTARLVAHVCELHGWTFVLLDRVQGLRKALEFANRYAPAVVFAEDIDRIASERSDGTNDLINVIDGVVSKSSEVMTILTTNFVEKLDPVILRPGRLDAVISLRAPDAETVRRLIRHYAGPTLELNADLTRAGEELAGQIPASIREAVERAKLGMIGRDANVLNDRDFVVAALTMKNHLALLNRKVAEQSTAEKLAESLEAVIVGKRNGDGSTNQMVESMMDQVRDIHHTVC